MQSLPVIRDYKYEVPGKGRVCYFEDLNDVRRRIVRDLDLRPDMRFLDVGTGDGWFTLEAQKCLPDGLTATIELGWDDVDDLIEKSRALGGKPLHYLRMDAYRQAFASESFDAAGSFLAVQDISFSVEELKRWVQEIARVLKPGGWLMIATVTPEDADTESQRLGIEIYRFIRAGYFSQAEIREALGTAGFVVEPFRFYQTGVNLSPEAARRFIKFQCKFWVDYYSLDTVNWQTTWDRYGSRIQELGGLEVEAKITVALARKK